MNIHQKSIDIQTHGRSTYDITTKIDNIIHESGIKVGLCHIFIHHTSASLMITENADPDVRHDLETIFKRLVPDNDPTYSHHNEGIDDMSAHARCVLTKTELTIPITTGRAALGTWQGIYLYEHRAGHFRRELTVTIYGE